MSILHAIQKPPTRVPRYEAPASLAAALQIMSDLGPAARVIAGGTDLVVELDRGAHRDVEVLVDLGRIPGLAEVTADDTALHLGPLVTHNQVVASDLCRRHALPLAQACLEVGSPQLRNRATVVGNIVTASPANDTISALIALGASIEVSSAQGQRRLALVDFITGFRTTDLAPHELVTDVVLPLMGQDQRGIFVKLGLRRAQAISVVHLAATVKISEGIVTDATLALGSVAPTVILVDDLADRLSGRELGAESIANAAAAAVSAAAPIDDLRASASYRMELLDTMTRRAFAALAQDQQTLCWPEKPPLLWGPNFDGRFPTGPELATRLDRSDVLSTTVNGATASAANAPGVTLLDWLREEIGIMGVKEGCAEGECGACTVDLDGAAVMSCLVPAARANGADIVTVEGLAGRDELHAIQQAFIDTGAVQCGFCTPGLLVACAKLLEETPSPAPGQVVAALAGNLCRCTGYRSIEAAVAQVAAAGGGESGVER